MNAGLPTGWLVVGVEGDRLVVQRSDGSQQLVSKKVFENSLRKPLTSVEGAG